MKSKGYKLHNFFVFSPTARIHDQADQLLSKRRGTKSTVKKPQTKSNKNQTNKNPNIQGLVAFAPIITRQELQFMPRQVWKNSTHSPRDYIYHSTFQSNPYLRCFEKWHNHYVTVIYNRARHYLRRRFCVFSINTSTVLRWLSFHTSNSFCFIWKRRWSGLVHLK